MLRMLATTTAVVSMVAKHTRCTEIPQFPDYSNAAAIAVNLATKGRNSELDSERSSRARAVQFPHRSLQNFPHLTPPPSGAHH
jgi:hypothetical protein